MANESLGVTLDNSAIAKTYSTFTGTDITTVFGNMTVTTLQAISYSITRQKAPIYRMGLADPVSMGRSKRGIAGSIIMTMFDRHALADIMKVSRFAAKRGTYETTSANPYKHLSESRPFDAMLGKTLQTAPATEQTIDGSRVSQETILDNGGNSEVGQIYVAQTINNNSTDLGSAVSEAAVPMYADQLLPFDVSMVGANEYGQNAAMRMYGLEILNEGYGASVDDVSNEMQMTYLAKFISPWVPQERTTDGSYRYSS